MVTFSFGQLKIVIFTFDQNKLHLFYIFKRINNIANKLGGHPLLLIRFLGPSSKRHLLRNVSQLSP